MKNYLAFIVLVFTLNLGFGQNMKSDMTEVVKYLSSDKLEGRETGTKAEKKAAKDKKDNAKHRQRRFVRTFFSRGICATQNFNNRFGTRLLESLLILSSSGLIHRFFDRINFSRE